jgi:hypothetical protein
LFIIGAALGPHYPYHIIINSDSAKCSPNDSVQPRRRRTLGMLHVQDKQLRGRCSGNPRFLGLLYAINVGPSDHKWQRSHPQHRDGLPPVQPMSAVDTAGVKRPNKALARP